MGITSCADQFYEEFFSQREAFDAVDAENKRRRESDAYSMPLASFAVDGLLGVPSPAAHKRLRRMEGLFHINALTTWERASSRRKHYIIRPWCWERPRPPQPPLRKYIAASATRMWHAIQQQPGQRHVYEIIRQGTPCNLYFDLEYQIADNEGADGNEVVERLLQIVDSITRATWDLPVERSAVVEMESCHPNKWSRHLLVGLPGCAFLSALEAGAFVKNAVLKHQDADKLLIRSTQLSFVDASVYSRNRCFRCLFCTKAPASDGRVVGGPFVLTHRLTHRLVGMSEGQQWWNCLTCNVPPSARLLQFGPEEKARCSALLETAQAPRLLTDAPHGASASPARKAPSAPKPTGRFQCCPLCQFTFADDTVDATVPVKWLVGTKPNAEKMAFLKRATPDLLDLARQLLGYDINVRNICVLNGHGLVSFDLCAPPGSRAANYCIWERRFHKSNFSMLKADFWYGTFTVHCWDPECRTKHAWEWYVHPFSIPLRLQDGNTLFDEPPQLDEEEIQQLLVYADGSTDANTQLKPTSFRADNDGLSCTAAGQEPS